MKRLFTLALMLTLLTLMITPAAATPARIPIADLTALAAVMPGDSIFFGAFRIDDRYVDALDGALDRIEAALPGMIPPTGLRDQLDELSKPLGGSFEQVFGAWLGDTAAFSLNNFEMEMMQYGNLEESLTVAIAIDDQAAAEAFFDGQVETGAMQAIKSEADGVIRYDASNDSPISLTISADTLILGAAAQQNDRSARLNANERFTDAMAALTEDDYNIALYIDMQQYMALSLDTLNQSMRGMDMGTMNPAFDMLDSFVSIYGGAGIGFTIVDERSFVMDVSVGLDMAAYEAAFGIDIMGFMPSSIDPTFARYIPAGTPLFVHSAGLATSYNAYMTTLESGIMSDLYGDALMGDFDAIMGQIEFTVRGATGLTLDEIFGWMEGDYALWLSLSPALVDATDLQTAMTQALPIDFGLLVDATPDPDAAAALVEGFGRLFDLAAAQAGRSSTDVYVAETTIEDATAVTLTISDPSMPFPIELIAASNADVFVFGTARAVRSALNPTNGMDSDPTFQTAASYLLPNTPLVVYAAGGGFWSLARLADANPQAEQIVTGLLTLLNSSTMSQQLTAEGVSIARFVVTLPE